MNKLIVSVNIYTCSYLALFSGVVFFVALHLSLEVDDEEHSEECDDCYVGEGRAGGGRVLVVNHPLLLGSPESGKLSGGLLHEGLEGRGVNYPPAQDGGAGSHPNYGRSHANQTGSDHLGNAHDARVFWMSLNLEKVCVCLLRCGRFIERLLCLFVVAGAL